MICVYKKVFLKQDRNELEKTIVYMVDMSPLPMSCSIVMKIATPNDPRYSAWSHHLWWLLIANQRMLWNVSHTAAGFLEVPEPVYKEGASWLRHWSSREVGALRFLKLRRKTETSMPRLPLLLLLLWGAASHGFPAATSETQEQDVEMVQVNAEFHMPKMQKPYLCFPTI